MMTTSKTPRPLMAVVLPPATNVVAVPLPQAAPLPRAPTLADPPRHTHPMPPSLRRLVSPPASPAANSLTLRIIPSSSSSLRSTSARRHRPSSSTNKCPPHRPSSIRAARMRTIPASNSSTNPSSTTPPCTAARTCCPAATHIPGLARLQRRVHLDNSLVAWRLPLRHNNTIGAVLSNNRRWDREGTMAGDKWCLLGSRALSLAVVYLLLVRP